MPKYLSFYPPLKLILSIAAIVFCLTAQSQSSLPPGSTMDICGDPTPAGWITISQGPICFQNVMTRIYSKKIMYIVGMAPGSVVDLCGDPTPSGWITISQGPICFDNVMTRIYSKKIMKIDCLPVGTTLDVCGDPTPAGWITISQGPICFDNVMTRIYSKKIQKITETGCTKLNQTITFDPIPNKIVGNAPFPLTSSSSSGLPVSYTLTSVPQGIATLSGNMVTILGAGHVTIQASQSGNGVYNAAAIVVREFDITRTYYRDADSDGYGDPNNTTTGTTLPLGYVLLPGDYRDDDKTINPGAVEVCDSKDNDCDGQIDEGVKQTYYRDADGDGYGSNTSMIACTAPIGYVNKNGDCNDNNTAIKPGATELHNGVDDNCNGIIDEIPSCSNVIKQWDKRFGGISSDDLMTFQRTRDGGFILGGNSYDYDGLGGDRKQPNKGQPDYWLVKTDSSWNIQWEKNFGVDAESGSYFNIVQQTADGGYILGGTSTASVGGGDQSQPPWAPYSQDYWIIKLSSNGTKEWDYIFGGTGQDVLTCLQQTPDGGYILGGGTDSPVSGNITDPKQDGIGNIDFWVVKLNSNGTKNWDYRYGGSADESISAMQVLPDGSALLGGYSTSNSGRHKTDNNRGVFDYWVVKINATGKYLWDKTFGGTGADGISSIEVSVDGGYILAGRSESPMSGDKTEPSRDTATTAFYKGDIWLVKIDANGNKQWDKTLGGSRFDDPGSIRKTSDGGYVLGGRSNSPASGDKTENSRDQISLFQSDMWVIKIDANGNKQWDKTLGGNAPDWANSILQTPDGGYIVGGTSHSGKSGDVSEENHGVNSDFWIVKLSSDAQRTFYKDADKDGYGSSTKVNACVAPAGYVAIPGDCNDANAAIKPGAVQLCNGIDDDCDGIIDDGLTQKRFYQDNDKDGFGNRKVYKLACAAPVGYVADSTDCNDGNKTIYPTAPELCDGLDNDCDGVLDDGLVLKTFYKDADKDGYGSSTKVNACVAPAGYVAIPGDCNDANAAIKPGATEVNNGVDDDCDGIIDEGITCNSVVKHWDATFGGDADDHPMSVQKTKDGGYIFGASAFSGISGDKTQASYGMQDYWVVKTNANGVKQWDARYGGSNSDVFQYMHPTSDGGYILGGYSNSNTGNDKTQDSKGSADYWIVKIDANGIKQWDKDFGGDASEELWTVLQTSDGGYILGGSSNSSISGDKTQNSKGSYDYWVVKTDANGNKLWDQSYGGNDYDILVSLKQTSDGGYVLGGYSLSSISGDKTQASQGSSDYWIVKINANGVKQWDKRFGGSLGDGLTDIIQTSDAGYLLGGYSVSPISGDKTQDNRDASSSSNDYWIVKTDANGNKQWDKRFGGNSEDELDVIQQTTDGGYILGGWSKSDISGDKTQPSQGGYDLWLVKTDNNGTKIWDARLGGSNDERYPRLQQASDGGYIVAASSNSNNNGDKSQSSKGGYDIWIVKLGCAPQNTTTTSITSNSGTKLSVAPPEQSSSLTLYPNPTTGNITLSYNSNTAGKVQLKVYDMTGRMAFSKSVVATKGTNNFQVDLSRLASGTYNLQLINGHVQKQAKLILQK